MAEGAYDKVISGVLWRGELAEGYETMDEIPVKGQTRLHPSGELHQRRLQPFSRPCHLFASSASLLQKIQASSSCTKEVIPLVGPISACILYSAIYFGPKWAELPLFL